MPVDPQVYEKTTAIALHLMIKVSLKRSYPNLSVAEHNEMFINIIDQMARMRGWAIRRERSMAEEDEGE
jgi:hypothetical protein